MIRPLVSLVRWAALVVLVAIVLGCGGKKKALPSQTPPVVRNTVKLRVAVADDPQLKGAVELLRGEWSERSGGSLEVVECTAETLSDAAVDADLIVFASRRLGALCEEGLLRPMRASVLDDEELRLDDFFPLIREHEMVYGRRVMALPLGCPTPLVVRLAEPTETTRGVRLPEGDRWLARVYLAWAAPHAVHRSREATLFDHATMRPHLAEPPFERALDLLADAQPKGAESSDLVTWPSRSTVLPEGTGEWLVESIPGAEESYNPLSQEWEPLAGDMQRATLLASSGRLLGVTTSTRNAATAFRFASWLASGANSRQLSAASDHTANCRGSLARGADPWLEADRDLARQFALQNSEALRRGRSLSVPRIPGVDAYLDALGAQVHRRLAGEATSAEALAAAAEAWEAITHEHGRENQRKAYRRSIGVEEYGE